LGAALVGVDGVPIEIEVRLSSQLPRVDVVGLPEAAVREAAARVRAAIAAVGLRFPDRRVTVNLAPAALRKSGAGLDLPIAVGILAAAGAVPNEALPGLGLLGELALDGRIRSVRGALPQVAALAAAGCSRVVAPAADAAEVALAPGAEVLVAGSLQEVVHALIGEHRLPAPDPPAPAASPAGAIDLSHIHGQSQAKRALEIAAAGGHGLLLRGAPGAGKTLLASALPGLLAPLSFDEALEVTRIQSAAGLLDADAPLALRRPFRAPHHSATRAGLLGGGSPPRPGEVTLAHRGVLFLDELPEFERRSLEALRQILELGEVHLARAAALLQLPARFQLVAAANPCPCGWYQSGVRDCRCDEVAIARYAARISGPLLDRIDLQLQVQPVPWRELGAERGTAAESSERVRERVCRARERQAERLAELGIRTNSEIPPGRLEALVHAVPEARSLLGRAVDQLALSVRGAHRVLRVARTIADLAGEGEAGVNAVSEAISMRGEYGGGT
jgi:magnesium chelatase family protein